MRVLLGFLLAPLTVGLIFLVYSIATGELGEGIWAFVLASLVGYMVSLIFGLPTYLLLQRLERRAAMDYVVSSLIISLILVALLVVLPAVSGESGPIGTYLAQGAFIVAGALITGFCFWLIVRPDRGARS